MSLPPIPQPFEMGQSHLHNEDVMAIGDIIREPSSDAPFGLHNLGTSLPHTTFTGTGHWLHMDKLVKIENPLDGVASEPGSDVNVDPIRESHREGRRKATSAGLHLTCGGLTHKLTGESYHATN